MSEYRFDQIAINSTEKKKPEESDKYTYIGLEHLDSRDLEVHRWGAEVAPKGEKLLMKKGDVLFGKRRAYQKKVAIAPFDGIFSAHGMVLRPNEKIVDKDFFPLFISSDYFLDAAIKISVGSLSPTINWRDLRELKFCLPDLETQRKLAKVLWAINATMQKYKVLLAKTDELVKSQFIELLNTAESEEDLIKHVNVLYGYPFNSKMFNTDGNGLPLIRVRDINSGFSDTFTTEIADEQYIVENGDCLVGMDGNFEIVKWKHGKALLNQRTCKLTPIDIKREFMLHYMRLKLKELESVANSTTVKHLSAKDISKMKIPAVDLLRQEEFEKFSLQSDKSKFGKEMCDKWILEIQNIYRQGYLI